MRIVSWTVVVGSIAALLYTSFGSLLGGFKLPPVSDSDVGGTMLSRPADQASTPDTQDAKRVMEACNQRASTGADQYGDDDLETCNSAAVVQN